MDDVDYLLPQSMNDFGNCIMQLLATLIFISVIQPWFLAGMVPLMVLYFCIQKFYRRSYVELQRTDAVTRSPLYAHFSETLSGVDSIRAYGVSQRFAERSDHQVDFNHRCGSPLLACCPPFSTLTRFGWRVDLRVSIRNLRIASRVLRFGTRPECRTLIAGLSPES
jgi:ABC-type multidrug transport system fused ATPase/permease subunit